MVSQYLHREPLAFYNQEMKTRKLQPETLREHILNTFNEFEGVYGDKYSTLIANRLLITYDFEIEKMLNLRNLIAHLIKFIISMHDIGKILKVYQVQYGLVELGLCNRNKMTFIGHEIFSAYTLLEFITEVLRRETQQEHELVEEIAATLACGVLGHHVAMRGLLDDYVGYIMYIEFEDLINEIIKCINVQRNELLEAEQSHIDIILQVAKDLLSRTNLLNHFNLLKSSIESFKKGLNIQKIQLDIKARILRRANTVSYTHLTLPTKA